MNPREIRPVRSLRSPQSAPLSVATLACASACALVLAGCGTAMPTASQGTIASHLAAAEEAAGSDMPALLSLCKQPAAVKPTQAETEKGLAALIAQPAPPAGQAFDKLFFVGAKWVSAWAIKTSDGIVLIDALNNQAEAASLIEGGLRSFGMDPAQIKYVIVTHGHGDHYGGVEYLLQHDHPRVVMSGLDWTMTETRLEFSSVQWPAPPKRDIAIQDGDRITLGDTTVTLYVTPGHTMGAVSPVFEVKANGKTHRVLLWGGTAFNFGKDLPRLDAYVASTERMRKIVRQQGIDVLISNHSGYDGSLEKLAQLRASPGAAENPFVIGTPNVLRALTVMGECASATHDRFALEP